MSKRRKVAARRRKKPPPRRRRLVYAAVASAAVVLLALWFGPPLATLRRAFDVDDARPVIVLVTPGMTGVDIAARLQTQGLIADDRAFLRALRFAGKENALRAGEYELSPSMTTSELIDVLQTGRPAGRRVTLPEGLRQEQVVDRLVAAGLGDRATFEALLNDDATRAAFGVPAIGAGGQDGVPGGVEGYLFPDTYTFDRSATPRDVVFRLRRRLDEVLTPTLYAQMTARGFTLHQTLTLASIIEEETAVASERAHISAVFHNRLKKKMRLQTDPTVLYAADARDRSIRRADLRRDHPYNTYVIPGLPPGPIAQPGLASIVAALNPDGSDDLFFVAKGDSGEHEFCPDLGCHNRAVQRWQIDWRSEGDRSNKASRERRRR